jgi:hypothetical protein
MQHTGLTDRRDRAIQFTEQNGTEVFSYFHLLLIDERMKTV